MMTNFLQKLISRLSSNVFKPVPEGILYIFLQAISREFSGICPWDTNDKCWKNYTTFWYKNCRNANCPGYRHPIGLIAYTSESEPTSSVDNRFDYSSFRHLTNNDFIPIGTLGVNIKFDFGEYSDLGGYGAGYYGAKYYGDNSFYVPYADIQIGDKWYVPCYSNGTIGTPYPDPNNKGNYGSISKSGTYRGDHDTVYIVEIIDFKGYMQNFQDALLQISLATADGEWIDFWGEFFGLPRLFLVGGYENDSFYKSRILKEITRAKGTKAVLLEEIKKYFNSDLAEIIEYHQTGIWDGPVLNPTDPAFGLNPYQFYVNSPTQRAPSAKFIKTGTNLEVPGYGLPDYGTVYAYEGNEGYSGYGYGYGDFVELDNVGLQDAVGDWLFVPPVAIGDACLFGHDKKFSGLRLIFTDLGIGGTYVWEYWNGINWSLLTVSDSTSGFTQNGYVNWKLPNGWKAGKNIPYNLPNTIVNKFWVRVRITSVPTDYPVADYVGMLFVGQTCRGVYVANGLTYDPTKRDRNNCYIYSKTSFEKPLVESGLQEILDRLKTAGTIAIIK